MSPLGIQIMLFYYTRAAEDFNFGPMAQKELLGFFIDEDMLCETHSEGPEYAITDKGRFYVEALKSTPFPVVKYEIPAQG